MKELSARFGTAGTPDSFSAMGFRKTVQIPEYLERFGLNAFEYQCGRGVRVNAETAAVLGAGCRERNIALSLHAPYYISLSSVEEEKRLNSIGYILDSARAAKLMGADRIIVHSGSCGKMSREQALLLAGDTLRRALSAMEENNLSDITICPETMGKVNQLGNFEEVVELCSLDERLLPCIDFGHLYARSFGEVQGREHFQKILDVLANRLGTERGTAFHAHFSRIQYTEKGGEKCHLTFADTQYGPDYEPLCDLLAERALTPRIICESAGTQAEDARSMSQRYKKRLEKIC